LLALAILEEKPHQ